MPGQTISMLKKSSFLALLLLAATEAASAQSQLRIFNPQPNSNDRFGDAVAADGAWLMVGAPNESSGGVDAGAVYVYELDNGNYVQRARLIASDGASGDSFGNAIDIDGDVAVIGAWQDNLAAGSGAGSAYVFERIAGVWTQRVKLMAPDAATADAFGFAVGVSGDAILIGASLDDITGVGQNAGSAHLFRRNGGTWLHSAQLLASDGNAFNRFGAALAISGTNVLVGAQAADQGAGATYAYNISNGSATFQSRFVTNDRGATDAFGSAIALDGDTALIGAPQHSGTIGTLAGAAYIFTRSGGNWLQQLKLVEPATLAGDKFGFSLALSNNVAVVGAPSASAGCQGCGAASVYQRFGANWSRVSRLLAADAAQFDNLGTAVAATTEGAVLGAPNANDPGGSADAGSVVRFVLPLSSFRDGFE